MVLGLMGGGVGGRIQFRWIQILELWKIQIIIIIIMYQRQDVIGQHRSVRKGGRASSRVKV